jgi:hypothetical protein
MPAYDILKRGRWYSVFILDIGVVDGGDLQRPIKEIHGPYSDKRQSENTQDSAAKRDSTHPFALPSRSFRSSRAAAAAETLDEPPAPPSHQPPGPRRRLRRRQSDRISRPSNHDGGLG